MNKKIFNLFRIVVSAGLILYLVSSFDVGKIVEIALRIWKYRPEYLIFTLLGALFIIGVEGFRLQQILKIQDIRLPLPRLIRYCFIGMFFNNFLPTTIGGDVVKGLYIGRDSGKKVEPFVALAAVRIIGAVCLTLIAVGALVLGYNLLPSKIPALLVALLVIGVTFMLIFFTRRKLASKFLIVLKPFKSKSLRQNVIEVYRLFHSHQRFPFQIALATGATFLIEFLYIFLNFLIAQGLGFPEVRFEAFLLLIPLIAVATLIPSLNGLGVREGAYIYFFQDLIGAEAAGALSLVILAMVLYLGLIGGIVFLVSGSREKARS